MATRTYDFGRLVVSIGGVTAGEGGDWTYTVNGEAIEVDTLSEIAGALAWLINDGSNAVSFRAAAVGGELTITNAATEPTANFH